MGLIHDLPTCAELIDRIVAEAEETIRDRLSGMISPNNAASAAAPGSLSAASAGHGGVVAVRARL